MTSEGKPDALDSILAMIVAWFIGGWALMLLAPMLADLGLPHAAPGYGRCVLAVMLGRTVVSALDADRD